MKKVWKKPKLISFGSIESVTQMQIDDVIQLGEYVIPSDSLGLFSSLRL
ncbi:hypothetical protein [Lyngbya confervoides]|uniref:Uncharacterized protein n=1 Tax=Lyngbya confervoides BDU141951 TaxID=1574623 RepID=A0ABD4T1R7_9CYAN|nr:hypothetical protein [Lyngbya confervoides]MCM1982529.1 hypothetical protein [Lyngbya confervoides BDU141951]